MTMAGLKRWGYASCTLRLLRVSASHLHGESNAIHSCDEHDDITQSNDSDFPKLVPSNDAELLSQILLHQHNPFDAMESSLQLHGISLTPSLLQQTLLRLRHNSKVALSLFQHSLSLPTPSATTATYNLMIDIMSKVRQFDASWQLIIDMEQKHVPPNPFTFFVLIRRLIAAGLTRQAIRAFDDMSCFVVTESVDENHFCALLDTLCKYGHIKIAVEIFNKRKHGFCVSIRMYNVLIYGWCKIGDIHMAEKFMREMEEKSLWPNVVTYNVLLNGICRRAKLQPDWKFHRTIQLADNVFDEMLQRSVEPDVVSYSILIHLYSRAHKPHLTLSKLAWMKEKGVSPTVATYTSVIKCLSSCGMMDEAEELLCEMMRNGISPNSATYNCFFKEFRGRKDADSALKLYRKMREGGLVMPSAHTYNILLVMFMKLDRMETVREIWNDLRSSGCGADLDAYTLLIHGLCEKQKWKEACKFFVEMIEKGLLPQKITFETLYKGLIQSDNLRTWWRLKKRLNEESVAFSTQFNKFQLQPYRR